MMSKSELILAIVQGMLMIVLIIITFLYRKDSKRATLVSFINLLSTIEKERFESYFTQLKLVMSELFNKADDKLKAYMIDNLREEYKLRNSVLTIFHDKLKEADAEWKLNERLYRAVIKAYNPKADEEFERLIKEKISKYDKQTSTNSR